MSIEVKGKSQLMVPFFSIQKGDESEVSKFVARLNNWMGYISQGILLIMVFLTTFDVFGRFFFNKPITGTFELTELGLALMIFLGLGLTHLQDEHIAIDFLTTKMSKRNQAILDIVIDLLITAFMVLVAYNLWENSKRIANSNTVTGDLSLPIHVFIIIAALGTLAFALSALAKALNLLPKVVKKNVS